MQHSYLSRAFPLSMARVLIGPGRATSRRVSARIVDRLPSWSSSMLGVRQGLVVLAAVCILATGCRNPSPETSSGAIAPSPSKHAPGSVEQLLAIVAASDAQFEYVSKGMMHVDKGPEMAETLRRRYSAAGSPDVSPTSFITHYATWSESDHAKYRVRLADGTHMELAQWLHAQIRAR